MKMGDKDGIQIAHACLGPHHLLLGALTAIE